MLYLYPTTLVRCPVKFLGYLAGHSPERRPFIKRYRRKFSQTLLSLMEFVTQGRPSTLHLILSDSIQDLEKAQRNALRSSNLRKSLRGVGESTYKLVINVARDFGLLFIFRTLTKGPFVLTTELGSTISAILNTSEITEKLDEISRCYLFLVPGLIFSTKAKLITLAVLSLREGHIRDIHNSLLQNLETFSPLQKLAFEILDEIRTMNAPKRPGTRKEAYYSETEIILALLEMIGVIRTRDDFKYFSVVEGGREFLNARDVVGLLRYLNAPTFKYQFSIESTPIDELVGLSITHHNLLKILERLKDREREITVDLENPYRISNL